MRRHAFILALASLLASALPLSALDLTGIGAEFQVNTTTKGVQAFPAVASSPRGSFVVVWLGPDGDGRAQVFGQLFDPAGRRRGGQLQVSSSEVVQAPRVAMDGFGRFLVVWIAEGVQARLYGFDGKPLGDPFQVDGSGMQPATVGVAASRDGEFMVVWTTGSVDGRLFARRFDAQGQPREAPLQLRTDRDLTASELALAASASGDFLATWTEHNPDDSSDVWVQRFARASQAWGEPLRATVSPAFEIRYSPQAAFRPDGSFFLVWTVEPKFSFNQFPYQLVGLSFDAGGAPLGRPSVLLESRERAPAVVAADRNGNAVLVFDWIEMTLFGRAFDPSWQPLTPAFQIAGTSTADDVQPALANDEAGDFVAVWSGRLRDRSQPAAGQDVDDRGIFGQRLGNPRCAPGSEVLCLGPAGRFEVKVSWKNPFEGQTGAGHSLPLTGDTGALWFFQPDNLELMIKVLDARLLDGHFWIFYGALSNVEYTITVTDTKAGKEKRYQNPAGQFASRSDITTFADAGKSTSAAGDVPLALPVETASAGCPSAAESLCLAAGRFQIQVDFTDPNTGLAGTGRALPLTADTGAFWFFGPENLELLIKVLDGRLVNGRFWVFYGALSDVAYTITVTDTETGKQKVYRNEHGHLGSRGDVDAFLAN